MPTDTRIPCHRPHGPEHEGMPPAGSVCGACGGDVDAPATVAVVDTRPEADGTPTGLHGPRPDDDAGVPLETARAAWELDADDQADHEADPDWCGSCCKAREGVVNGACPDCRAHYDLSTDADHEADPPIDMLEVPGQLEYAGTMELTPRGRELVGEWADALAAAVSTDAARREADEAAAGPWHWECRSAPDAYTHATCGARGVADVAPDQCPSCGATTLVVKPVPPPPVLDAHQAEGPAAAAAYWAGPTTQPEAWTDVLRPPGGDEGGTPMAPAEVILRHLVVDAIDRHPNGRLRGYQLAIEAEHPARLLWPWLQLPEALAVYLDGLVREHAAPNEQVG